MVEDLGDVLVTVVGVEEIEIPILGTHDERARGDGLGGGPDIGVEEGVVGATELLDAEVVVVDEALEEVGVGGLGAHLDSAAHAVEGHRDHGVAGLPANGAVLGIVGDRPNAGGGS